MGVVLFEEVLVYPLRLDLGFCDWVHSDKILFENLSVVLEIVEAHVVKWGLSIEIKWAISAKKDRRYRKMQY